MTLPVGDLPNGTKLSNFIILQFVNFLHTFQKEKKVTYPIEMFLFPVYKQYMRRYGGHYGYAEF